VALGDCKNAEVIFYLVFIILVVLCAVFRVCSASQYFSLAEGKISLSL